jgi:hypothetical protein
MLKTALITPTSNIARHCDATTRVPKARPMPTIPSLNGRELRGSIDAMVCQRARTVLI